MAVEVSQGVCDLCGAPSDASLQECNWLTCTFQHCEGGLYHQECLEKYLKSNKLEKNRKTGFKCPRGCGKGTRFDQACPGRIDKSHPIHPRNEDKKKTKLAAVVIEPQRPTKASAPAVQNGKPGKGKDENKADAGKDSKSAAPAKAASGAKAVASSAAALPLPVVIQKTGKKEAAGLPPRPEAQTAKQKLERERELAAQARREIGLPAASSSSMSSHGSKGDLQGLSGSAAGPSKPPGTGTTSAWGKPSVPSPEPPAVSPQPTMMSELPQFQQLLQQAVGKKAAAKSAAAAAVTSSSQLKPAPAVPQPVLNPPTPMWPALGASQSVAALFSTSSAPAPSAQTPRESQPRPASPPSAWGPSSATQGGQQQAAPSTSSSTPAARTQSATAAGTSSSAGTGASSAGATAAAAPAAPAASPPASTSGAAAAAAAAAAATAGAAASAGVGPGSAAARAVVSGSGRGAAALPDTQQAPSGVAAASSSSAGASSRGDAQLVGADFVDEEPKEAKLTKAQKKNLKRTEKKKTPSGPASAEQQQQQQDAGEAGQDAAEAPSRSQGSLDGDASAVRAAAPASASAGVVGSLASVAGARQADASTSAAAAVSAPSASGSGVHRRHVSHGSEDPEPSHVAEAEQAAVMEELCINCIVARKVLALITQLQRLGALEFVAAAAVQRHGSNLLAALEWLLVAGADAANAPPEAVLAAASESASAAESEIDISEELQQLSDLQATLSVPTEVLQQCVLDCNGDVQTAANTAMERMLAAPASSTSGAAAVAAPAGVGAGHQVGATAGRVSSSSGSILTAAASGQGTIAAQMIRTSASFYSVSSLDGVPGCGADTDAALGHLKQQQQPHHRTSTSHFGVRLQDEPTESSSSGYGGPGGYTSGLLRGGALLGSASGWPNGYLRDAAPPGLAVGSGAGRSTSRLLHWLRDDPGRAAVLEEEASATGAANAAHPARTGPLCQGAQDPMLKSPFALHGGMARGLPGHEAGPEPPTFYSWLQSNGYHHHGAGVGGVAVHAGTTAATTLPSMSSAGTQELYCTNSNGNFSFVSALSKPSSSVVAQSVAAAESLVAGAGTYGSRWGNLAASGTHPYGGGGTAPAEAEATAHNDGDNDLSSIMALINVR